MTITTTRAGAAHTAPARRAARRGRVAEALWGFAFIAPTGLGLAVFYLWPVLQTAYFSMTEWGVFGGHTWTGAENYARLLADPEVGRALVNTLTYTALGLAGIPLAIVFAALLNRKGLRGVGVYRTLFFLPVVTMPVAVAMVWRWLYNGDYGLINHLLSLVGIDGPNWIADPATALYALVVVGVWSSLGYNMIIFLAGMQAIPAEYYEAAAIDGAGPVRQFFRITVPLLSPTAFFVSVVSVIGSLQLFDLVYVMAGAGGAARANPAYPRMQTVVQLFYDRAFVTNDRGYAAAIAMMLLVLIVALTAAQFRLQRRWVHYA
ncbi:multiple sugar transport system permease protein [Thermocatellispora tengchongensis]|uniref:Multiple sugar transport system permease protein n=1 Tax=Thermocatellispora tengchongensis TaxID=1073253 RepID=A0A840PEK2_9ACTN|nr:sugar ABC transporter permease [Thermocatellispora tengchongensis]MBB5134465.1 multiple sugar transport system permease protein [Thermocatellispora tengchongensis]